MSQKNIQNESFQSELYGK